MSNSNLLSGVTIVDLTHVLSGPFATMILRNLGARVIKVEPPKRGDDSRAFGPFVKDVSLYFSSINAGKESIALNLKDPADREVFEKLLSLADVVTENYRPGTMEKLGYGWDSLHEKFPHLIYGAASGFGHSGPDMKRAAYDIVVQAMGAVMSMTGQPDSPPTRVGVSIGDLAAGLYLAIGISAALYKRKSTGVGVKVDVGMLDCQATLLEGAIPDYVLNGVVPKPLGSRHPSIAPFQAFNTKDKPIVIAAGDDHLFQLMAVAISAPDIAQNPIFATNELRLEHICELQAEMEKVLVNRPSAEWLNLLDAAGVPCGPLNTVKELVANDQIAARNMIVKTMDPEVGQIMIAGNPVKISGVDDPSSVPPPPRLDEHRAEILKMLNNKDLPA
jgi:CoA:oxalate CoA-transferase